MGIYSLLLKTWSSEGMSATRIRIFDKDQYGGSRVISIMDSTRNAQMVVDNLCGEITQMAQGVLIKSADK